MEQPLEQKIKQIKEKQKSLEDQIAAAEASNNAGMENPEAKGGKKTKNIKA